MTTERKAQEVGKMSDEIADIQAIGARAAAMQMTSDETRMFINYMVGAAPDAVVRGLDFIQRKRDTRAACTCPPLAPGMGVVDVNRGHLLGCPVLVDQAGRYDDADGM